MGGILSTSELSDDTVYPSAVENYLQPIFLFKVLLASLRLNSYILQIKGAIYFATPTRYSGK